MIDLIILALRKRIWFLFNKHRFNFIGSKSYIYNPLKLTPKYIKIGKGCTIYKNCRIEGITSYEGINYTPSITLGDKVTVQQNLHLTCANSIFIGDNVAIAANVSITDIDHLYIDITRPIEKNKLMVKDVIIGENSKIYNNAVILPGTHIGKHSVIGANSVVNGDFPDYSIIVGSPGRIIKRYCAETKEWRKTDKEGNFF